MGLMYIEGEKRILAVEDRRYYRVSIKNLPSPVDGFYVVTDIQSFGRKDVSVSVLKYLGDIEKDEVKFILSISELNLETQKSTIELLKKFIPEKLTKEKLERIKNILQCLAIEDYGKLLEKTLVKSPPEYDEMLEIFKVDYQKVLKLYDEIYDRS